MFVRSIRRAWPLLLLAMCASLDAQTVRHTSMILILDCSASMGQSCPDDENTTRWQAAEATLQRLLNELAQSGDSRAAILCVGHRLKWEEGAEHPDLVEQDAYLQASVGFNALSGLLPGDDVERLQPLRPFSEQTMAILTPRIATLQPWGERPLNLAIIKALDELANEPATNNKRIVILTDGGDQRRMAQLAATTEMVIAALKQSLVPIHVLHFGSPADQASKAGRDLRQLAEYGGGDVRLLAGKDEIHLADVTKSRDIVAIKSGAEKGVATATGQEPQRTRLVTGNIVLNGHPVGLATISLAGSDLPPVKADKTGRFVIRDVPLGQYKIKVQAIAQNRTRNKTQELNVTGDRAAEVTIDVK